MKITVYDPPTGWRFGFPRRYSPLAGETIEQTLIRDGYPEREAGWAADCCRFWEVDDKPQLDKNSTTINL
jgi:hypothetical protein